MVTNTKQIKIDKMKKIQEMEDVILELEKWEPGKQINDKYASKVGFIESIEFRDKVISMFEDAIETMKSTNVDDDKLYLSEIIEKEKPIFDSNNLILAPVGSGKTRLIEEILLKDTKGKVLMLVSNTFLKDSFCSPSNDVRKKELNGRYTSKNKSTYGDTPYKMHVMTYHEFGDKIRLNDDFAHEFIKIFCDEIHSLPEYEEYGRNRGLILATKYLFQKHQNQSIYYFTATYENLDKMRKTNPGILNHVKNFNYLNHPDIRKYIALSEYKINRIEQIRSHLQARLESFNYFKYKCLAYNRTISGQKKIEEIAREEGFVPISIWSINNTEDKYTMDEEQLKVRNYLLEHGEIPEPYNFLIINSAMQEGWNLYDPKVKLAIINTTNQTQFTQALGRYRGDMDVLIYRVAREKEVDLIIDLPKMYIDKWLTSNMKDELCFQLNIINASGKVSKWGAISKLMIAQNYEIENSVKTIDGKRTRVSKITIKK